MKSSDLKILHINTLDSFGGASQVATDLLTSVREESHLVVGKQTTRNPKVIRLKKNILDGLFWLVDILLWKTKLHSSIRAILNFDSSANFTYTKLRSLPEYHEADIIHLHNLHGGYFDLEALRKIAQEKKMVWTLHDMWAITGGEAYTFENENYKKGIGYTPYKAYYPLLNPLLDRRQHFLEKKKKIYGEILSQITIVPVSSWLEKCFREAYVYSPGMRLQLIHNGVDTGVFRNENLRTWTKPRILFFNSENPFKGSDLLISILEKIENNFDLYIVGEKLKKDIPAVYFPYISSRARLNEIYNSCDILVFPSKAENFPLTVLEAMACGLCVVGSDAGGIPEMLDNSYGFLFKANQDEDLLVKINLALANLSTTRARGKVAEQRVRANFTLDKNAHRYSELYREILKFENWETVRPVSSDKMEIMISEFVNNISPDNLE